MMHWGCPDARDIGDGFCKLAKPGVTQMTPGFFASGGPENAISAGW